MLTIKDRTEITNVFFSISGLPKMWQEKKSFTQEVDEFLEINKIDRFGFGTNMETMDIYVEHGASEISPEAILDKIEKIARKHFPST